MIALLPLLIAAPALAGPPRTLEVRGPAPYVPVPAGATVDVSAPVCVDYDNRGMPVVRPCPELVAMLFLPRSCPGGSDALVCGVGGPTWAGWGAYSVSVPDADAGWVALDHRVTASEELRVVAANLLPSDELVRLADACGDMASVQVMTTAWMGCGDTRFLPGFDPAGPSQKVKGLFTAASAVGSPASRVTAGADATTCASAPVLVGATVQPVGQLCAQLIYPSAFAALRAQVSELSKAPDAAQTSLRDVLLELQGATATLGQLALSLDGSRTGLTTARGDLGATRIEVEDLGKATDDDFVEMLTELERLGSDIAETFVSLSTLGDRLEALERETMALREKASVPDADLILLGALNRDATDLLGRVGRLAVDLGDARTGVRKIERQVGFFQGRVAELKGALR